MRRNIILNVDSYKTGQFCQLPPGTKFMHAYIESRGGPVDYTLFFGLQIFLKEYLSQPITIEDINQAEKIFKLHGVAFNRAGWMYILKNYNGYLPILIHALPEGSIVANKNVLVTIQNTDPEVPWLVSYIETALLRAIWYPTTVATNSHRAKMIISHYLNTTCDNPDAEINFKLHDFGARGVSSDESAGIGGCAHLVNFMGTDTISALRYADEYYGMEMAGFSINAMEHSTVTAWGRDGETAAFSNMMDHYAKPDAMYACVSDSYDLWNAVDNIWGETLRDRVKASGARLVVRPDSGDALIVPRNCIRSLGSKYGYSINRKGYKVLHSSVRAIQGDGINIDTIGPILGNLVNDGWSSENLAMGMGGGLLQHVTRDDFKFAQKNSAININGNWYDTYKDPIDDPGKRSKSGRFKVIQDNGVWRTLPLLTPTDQPNMLRPAWRNGILLVDENFQVIRDRSKTSWNTFRIAA